MVFIFRQSDNLSASLQTKDLCAAEVQVIAAGLKNMRMDKNCHVLWKDVKQKASNLDFDAPKFSRKRRSPKRKEKYFGEKEAHEYASESIKITSRLPQE